MPQPVTFTRSAKSIASEKAVSLLIVLIVGAAFGYFGFFWPNTPTIIKVVSGGAVLIAVYLFQRILREMLLVLKNDAPWSVEISDDKLSWHSPLPELMKSFKVQLSDIAHVQFTMIRYRASNSSPKKKYHIELRDGSQIELRGQECGINPAKVFKELERRGTLYQQETVTKGSRAKVGTQTE